MTHILLLCRLLVPLLAMQAISCVVMAADASRQERLQEAMRSGDYKTALELANLAVADDPQSASTRLQRASVRSAMRDHDGAIADYDFVMQKLPRQARIFRLRGGAHFKAGHVENSIQDFEKAAQLEPELDKQLWELGISYYYAGEYTKGARQFDKYQTYYAADVENVVWKYLCEAQIDGPNQAQQNLMRLSGTDRRVPMMQIDALFRGKADPETVIAATREGDPNKQAVKEGEFYAHLYLALYYESLKQPEKAFKHMLQAEKREISHYMWDVAHVHAERLRKQRRDAANDREQSDEKETHDSSEQGTNP